MVAHIVPGQQMGILSARARLGVFFWVYPLVCTGAAYHIMKHGGPLRENMALNTGMAPSHFAINR